MRGGVEGWALALSHHAPDLYNRKVGSVGHDRMLVRCDAIAGTPTWHGFASAATTFVAFCRAEALLVARGFSRPRRPESEAYQCCASADSPYRDEPRSHRNHQVGGDQVENRVFVYSSDIAVPRRSGIEEMLVSAMTGAVVSQEHEGPKAEAAERAQDRRVARARPVAPTRKP